MTAARPGHGEQGSASVLVLALAGLLLLVGGVSAGVGSAVVARSRAESAADLGALAAAQAALRGPPHACAAAERVVRAVGGRVTVCWVQGVVAVLEVEVDLPGRLGALGPAQGRARAGRVQPAG